MDLCVAGTQVVLHYVFLGLEKTKDKYTGQDNTSELLELLQALDRHPHSSTPQVILDIHHSGPYLETLGSLTVPAFQRVQLKVPVF